MNSTSWAPPDPAAYGGAGLQYPPYRNSAAYVQSGIPNQQLSTSDFHKQCLSLARSLDNALANGEVPAIAKDLPELMKRLYRGKNDSSSQAALMILMIYVKNACKMGWFQPNEAEELFNIADEVEKIYCNMENINTEPSPCHSVISTVMERFYPKMNLGQILVSVETKPGYGAYTVDFQITKSTVQLDKICLLVAQTENIETSACLISPPQVSFLVNGNAVEGRTNVYMDPGPQLPTNVASILKFGTNLLQAVGQFNGHYVILVAHMNFRSLPDHPVLQDYVQPAATSVDTDSDIIEGPSQISLNCPISFSRIKTPVKGHSCKHFQCFDFDNFIDMNSRRPSWRCPHCNQYVSYTDIRLDRNMVEILKDVGENIVEVIVLADGSWKAVLENDRNVNKMQNKVHNCEKEPHDPQASILPDAVSNVLDLTIDDYHIDIMDTLETADRKLSPASVDTQSVTPNSTSLGMTSTSVDQNGTPHLEDDFWAGLDLVFGTSDAPTVGISEHPVLPDTSPHASFSNTATADSSIGILSDTERRQHFSRSPMNLPQVSGINPSALPNHSAPQNRVPPASNISASSPAPTPNRPHRSLSELGNPHLQRVLNPQAHPMMRSRSHIQQSGSNVQSAGATANSQQIRVDVPNQIRRLSSPVSGVPVTGDSSRGLTGDQRVNVGGTAQSVSRTNDSVNLQSEQSWRPTARMRGSLSGRQFSDDIRQRMIVPTQMAQDSRPPVLQPVQGSRPPGPTTLSLDALIMKNRNAHNHSPNT